MYNFVAGSTTPDDVLQVGIRFHRSISLRQPTLFATGVEKGIGRVIWGDFVL